MCVFAGLKLHRDQNPSIACLQVPNEKFQVAAEFEAILRVSSRITTLAQHERACNGGYKIMMHELSEDAYHPILGHLDVVDLDHVPASGKPPRKMLGRDDLTPTGREAFDNAGKAAKERHTMKGGDIVKRDYIAMGCDLRLVGRGVLSETTIEKAKSHVEEKYIAYEAKQLGEPAVDNSSNDTGPPAITYMNGIPVSQALTPATERIGPTFQQAWTNWLALSAGIQWKQAYAKDLEKVDCEEDIDVVHHLLTLDVLHGTYQTLIEKSETFFPIYGYLPHLALCYIGNNLASSFCERVNSCAKLIMGHDRTLLGDKHLEMLCFLRMNRTFIYYLKQKYPERIRAWADKQKAKLNT